MINENFHLKIALYCGNQVLYQYIRDIINKVNAYLIYDSSYSVPEYSHTDILDLIRDKKITEAKNAIEAHIQNALDRYNIEEFEKQQEEDYLSI